MKIARVTLTYQERYNEVTAMKINAQLQTENSKLCGQVRVLREALLRIIHKADSRPHAIMIAKEALKATE